MRIGSKMQAVGLDPRRAPATRWESVPSTSKEVIVTRYLVVAHETVTNPVLADQLREIQQKDPGAEFTLLVPATPVRHLLFLRGNEQDAAAAAAKLATKAQKMLTQNHVNLVDAHVGSESPVDAIDHEIGANPGYAGFVISTLPEETSRWLRMGLPTVVEKKYGLPVHHVQAAPDWTANYFP